MAKPPKSLCEFLENYDYVQKLCEVTNYTTCHHLLKGNAQQVYQQVSRSPLMQFGIEYSNPNPKFFRAVANFLINIYTHIVSEL
jgi:hypothetical protein